MINPADALDKVTDVYVPLVFLVALLLFNALVLIYILRKRREIVWDSVPRSEEKLAAIEAPVGGSNGHTAAELNARAVVPSSSSSPPPLHNGQKQLPADSNSDDSTCAIEMERL